MWRSQILRSKSKFERLNPWRRDRPLYPSGPSIWKSAGFQFLVGSRKRPLAYITSYQTWVPGYLRNSAEDRTFKESPTIDQGILEWTIGALGDDDTLENFFEDIPGFFQSQTVKDLKGHLPDTFISRFSDSWGGFLTRNLLSNSVNETVKARRLDICMKAMKAIYADNGPSKIFRYFSHLRFDQSPPSLHTAEILVSLCKSSDSDTSELARYTVAKMLPYVRERNDRWIELTQDIFRSPKGILREYIAHGDDSVMLVILIYAARQVIITEPRQWELLSSISKFDILKTLSGLQNEFCSLWNEIVQEAWLRGHHHLDILRGIRHLYIDLHQSTDCAPMFFDASTPDDDFALYNVASYLKCTISAHRSESTVPLLPRLEGPHDPSPPPSPSAPLHSQEFSSPSPDTVPKHIAPEANPATLSSIHESIETVTLDTTRLVVTDVSYSSYQSSPPTASLTANTVRSHHRTTDVPINQMDQASRTPGATFHTLPQSDAVPVVVAPSAVPSAPGDSSTLFFYRLPRHLRLLVLQTTVTRRRV